VDQTRQELTTFFNGDNPDRLCFSYNSTDALNLIIFGILKKGDHAITTTLEHNAVLRPLYHLYQDYGVEVDHVPFDGKGFVDPEAFKKKFKSNTRLVVVNHASNVLGTVQPIEAIGRLCKEAGIAFAIDASQSAGKVPIDMKAMNIDIVAFTGHKSLMGPTGIGGLCVREGIEIRHTRAGGTGVKSAQRRHLDEYPYRLEYGTVNVQGVAGLHAGLQWVLDKGVDTVHSREMALAHKLRDGLAAIEGVKFYCQEDLRDHIAVLSFNIVGLKALDTGTMLDGEYNIACRAGLHCAPLIHEHLGTDKIGGAVRLSIGPFITEAHIEKVIEAVSEIVDFQIKRTGKN
jgi:cysteine desulfurase family protein